VEIVNTKIFRADFTTFRRAGGGCVNTARSELWVDDFEIIAVEVKGSDPKCKWEIVGIYRAPNQNIGVTEMLTARSGILGNSMKRSIIGGDWCRTMGTLRWLENLPVGIHYRTFTFFDRKMQSF